MCGIFCCFPLKNGSNADQKMKQIYEDYFKSFLQHRGPNSENCCIFQDIFFAGHVLWHQGENLMQQPNISDQGILLFNGDLFMNDANVEKNGDSYWLNRSLSKCETSTDVRKLLGTLVGPYSLIYYQKSTETLFFCRDLLGRNSLILATDGNYLLLSSTSNEDIEYRQIELPAIGIFEIHRGDSRIYFTCWNEITHDSPYVDKEENILTNFLRDHGIEYEWSKMNVKPLWPSIEYPELDYRFNEMFKEIPRGNYEVVFRTVIETVPNVIDQVIDLLEKSVKDRVKMTQENCKNCLRKREPQCTHATVGILFSGGIDCTILAILADRFVPKHKPIDLLNVAFEKVNQNRVNEPETIDWNVPDRESAKKAIEELREICPSRTWNLIESNITKKEKFSREEIAHLIHPRKTVLDESVGIALWFAARGIDSSTGYKSPCRVLLIGSGADELFGGYTRHQVAFRRNGEMGLWNELQMDWDRLPSRNLARDDRVICDHGVTPRAPYIEENLAEFVLQLKPLQKCFPPLGPGIGDKTLLRACGYFLGLRETSFRSKKALQFGSKIANSRQNANDTSAFLSRELRQENS